ncbi:MAG TPA: hypothetical protein VJ577_05455 [Burkholderiaceae bacterium]|nr:hypothetical protein [Burkholderiaceae bacterium]
MNSKPLAFDSQEHRIAVLFARQDSIYKRRSDLDVYDIERDARTYTGHFPVVAHPPCRSWGRLRKFAKPRHDERDLAFFAVNAVRIFGGVLEHPSGSTLWQAANLPLPGQRDEFGGSTLPILQSWFGHECPKSTWLYIVGVNPTDIPDFPLQLGIPPGRIERISKAARERTPAPFANWLVDLAVKCGVSK